MRGQHNCNTWTEERRYRFTASNFGKVSRRKRNHKKFCNDFVVYMSRGLSIERIHFDEEHWKKHRAMEECLAQHLEGAGPAL